MTGIGWRPRAAGWFTLDLGEGRLGVVAENVASEHARAGTADVSLHVGLRLEEIESIVEEITGRPGSYQHRTTVTSIGHVSPEARWLSWPIDEASCDRVAHELARQVSTYAVPYLQELTTDPAALMKAARSTFAQSTGKCRVAVMTAQSQGAAQARAFLRDLDEEFRNRHDAAADDVRETIRRTREWISGSR